MAGISIKEDTLGTQSSLLKAINHLFYGFISLVDVIVSARKWFAKASDNLDCQLIAVNYWLWLSFVLANPRLDSSGYTGHGYHLKQIRRLYAFSGTG